MKAIARNIPATVPSGPAPARRERAVEHFVHSDVVASAAHGSPIDASKVSRLVIVRASDGGQLRTVLTGTKVVRTIAYPSRRYRCVRYGEAETECSMIEQQEVCPVTVAAISQPMRIEALVDGVWLRTIVDASVLRVDGERALVECKRDWSGFRTRDGAIQTFLGGLAAGALGWRYERRVLAHSGSPRRRANVGEVASCRFVHVSDSLVSRVTRLLAGGPVALRTLGAVLHNDPANGRARAFALMARRIVDIDLDGPLDGRAECRAAPVAIGRLPSLRR